MVYMAVSLQARLSNRPPVVTPVYLSTRLAEAAALRQCFVHLSAVSQILPHAAFLREKTI